MTHARNSLFSRWELRTSKSPVALACGSATCTGSTPCGFPLSAPFVDGEAVDSGSAPVILASPAAGGSGEENVCSVGSPSIAGVSLVEEDDAKVSVTGRGSVPYGVEPTSFETCDVEDSPAEESEGGLAVASVEYELVRVRSEVMNRGCAKG